MKKLEFKKLLDYVEGNLSFSEMMEVDDALDKSPLDQEVVEGLNLMYADKGIKKEELEDFIQNMEFKVPSSLLPEQKAKPKIFEIFVYTIVFLLSLGIQNCFSYRDTNECINEHFSQNNKYIAYFSVQEKKDLLRNIKSCQIKKIKNKKQYNCEVI